MRAGHMLSAEDAAHRNLVALFFWGPSDRRPLCQTPQDNKA